MRKVFTLVTELVLVVMAMFIADWWQSKSDIIPRSLIRLPKVDYTNADFWLVLKIFLVLFLVAFLLMQFIAGAWRMSDTRRSVSEIYLLIATYSVASLVVFVGTTVNFDPHFMAAVGLSSIGLFMAVHLIAVSISRLNPAVALFQLVKGMVTKLASISGVVSLLLAMTPPVLAYLFTTNQDVGNVITQIRIKATSLFAESHGYALVNMTGNYRFIQPMHAINPPHTGSEIYVLERAGRLMKSGYPFKLPVQPEVVLDIRDKVGEVQIENGTLGFAFHPEFGRIDSSNSGYIYVYYTDVREGRQFNRLSRFDLESESLQATSDSELPLMVLGRETSGFHNGGSVEFGPDGFLYVALGEGVHLEDTSSARTLRAGIIRIDVDMKGGEISRPVSENPANGTVQNYYIPIDNPFIGKVSVRDEYWALGLRNPFRISFDSKTGALWAGDVGSTKWEEVNLITRGGHYQYPFVQGYEASAEKPPINIFDFGEEPVYTYRHTAYDRAVIGGIVNRGDQFPDLKGQYIFADNYSSKVFAMPGDGRRVKEVNEIAKATQFAQRGISSISQLKSGDILFTTLGRSTVATGEILKLVVADEEYKAARSEQIASHDHESDHVHGEEFMPISAVEAKEIFISNCGRCHGAGGDGVGPDVSQLGVAVPDFTSADFQKARTDAELEKVISKGGIEAGLSPVMPPWNNILSEAEIKALVSFIRDLK